MPSFLDITADDILRLNDRALRELIGRLCEADFRKAARSTAGITSGGAQDAPDGGFDVVVDCNVPPPSESFIQRRYTGIQVKKPDMARAAILNEMRPNGVLRPAIAELIAKSGSYLIVNSTGSVSASALDNRRRAMREAVDSEPGNENLHLDFLDRNRIATWVRSHPSLILWIRNQIGRSLTGWRPFDNWSHVRAGVQEEYLIDEHLRLYDGRRGVDGSFSLFEGIQSLRRILASPGSAIRLAGLSGVGKTRLVQALFDEHVGTNALNPVQAFYADIGDGPSPDPRSFAEQLIADGTRAVLIIDNCPPDLHRRLIPVCSVIGSAISLITVEYDIREDLPDETSVFRLEPASEDLIFKLVARQFPHVTQVDAQQIAEFSGGNARLAINLADTVRVGQTISGFTDEQLFTRLFEQRHAHDADLLLLAEACSLVYSFDGANIDKNSELWRLASLVERSPSDIYRSVGELRDRDLVQARGVWRSILPQAIANRLAARALSRISKQRIVSTFLDSNSDRFIKSFTRRLNFLHDCNDAIEIVNEWLTAGGWLGEHIGNLSQFGMEVFTNVAPVSPTRTLKAIERIANGPCGDQFTSRENANFRDFVRLLRSLAYDRDLFLGSVRILIHFALSEEPDENHDLSLDVLKSFFRLFLSGTLATPEDRLVVIEELLDSDRERSQQLGITLLKEALEAWHFSSTQDFDFGARPRSHGYHPRSRADLEIWFRTFIEKCTRVAVSNSSVADTARMVLAEQFRGLLTRGEMFAELEAAASAIRAVHPWCEGWIAVSETFRFDKENLQPSAVDALRRIENLLQPIGLYDRARTYALSEVRSFGLDDLDNDKAPRAALARAEEIARQIGEEVARDEASLAALLPEIVTSKGHRLGSFGEGLWRGAVNRQAVWDSLRTHLELSVAGKRQVTVFQGFFVGAARDDHQFCELALDKIVDDPLLGPSLPWFQAVIGIDERGLERLHEGLDTGITPVDAYRLLAFGSIPRSIDDTELATLLGKIAPRIGGFEVVVDILQMTLHAMCTEGGSCSEILLQCARNLLGLFDPSLENRKGCDLDFTLGFIANHCLAGDAGDEVAGIICGRLREAVDQYRCYMFDYYELQKAVARRQPLVFLNAFFDNSGGPQSGRRRIYDDGVVHRNPLSEICDDVILLWCAVDPCTRYSRILSEIPLLSQEGELKEPTWRPLVLAILERMPASAVVYDSLLDALAPTTWSGSRADVMQRRLPLLRQLFNNKSVEIAAWARSKYIVMENRIRIEREHEDASSRERDERFE